MKLYLKMRYKKIFGKELDLRNPKTFNEKLNWLKIYGYKNSYSQLVDKYEVKNIVSSRIGYEYVVPCYGVWDNFDDVDFAKLPVSFVLKSTHDSSGAFVCKNKNEINKELLKVEFDKKLRYNWYWINRERPYKDLKPRIIAEELLDDKSGKEIKDYKFLCFNGQPKVMYVTNKGSKIEENYYDMDFNVLDISHGYSRTIPEYIKPKNFNLMRNLAAVLSKDIPFVRVDFFDVNGKVYFGEYTFYDWGGIKPLNDYWEYKLGSWIELHPRT